MSALRGFLVVRKREVDLSITTEAWPVQLGRTPEQEYERAVWLERHRAEAAAREQALARMWSTVLGVADQQGDRALLAVLQLHSPDTEARAWLTCPVCDADDMDPGDWPCRTVQVIAAAYGIEVPL